ncbi:MAG: hypothetical protein GWN24_13360 [Nitrospinaceae bacterium]|nr:hypothetical protein [Nitrospinaceae bacterium]
MVESSRGKIMKLMVVPLLVGFWLSLNGIGLEPAWAQTSSRSKKALARQLYKVSGMSREKAALRKKKVKAELFTRPRLLSALGLSNEHVKLVNSIYKNSFRINSYFNARLKAIIKDFDRGHVRKSIRFFRSSVGRKSVRLHVQSMKKSKRSYQKFLKGIIDKPPVKKRIELFDRLERANRAVDHLFEYEATVLNATNPVNQKFKAPHAETLISRMNSSLRERFRSWMLLRYMFMFKGLSERELTRLVKFYESPSGQWFQRVEHAGNLAGFATLNRRARQKMNKLLQKMESKQEDTLAARTVFGPGVRYLFKDKRDPFNPLVVPPKPKKKAAPATRRGKGKKKTKVTTQQVQIDGLPAIPMELYRRVKERDPRLYSDLEYYGALFKNKKGLGKLKKNELKGEISQYKKLIKKARKTVEDLLETPLQARLKSLRLAGVVWDDQEAVGLIETKDPKGFMMGHTIRIGSFVGPNFGVVQSIDEERIVVVEELRKYDGNLITKTKFIEFPKPDTKE